MAEAKSIVTYQTREYGVVKVKLAALMDRYYKNEVVSMVDMDFLAKVCYVLDCRVEDVLEYEKPAESAP